MASPPAVRSRDAFYRRILAAADIAAVLCAVALTFVVGGGAAHLAAALLTVPLVLVAAKLSGLYDRDELLLRKSSTLDELPTILNVVTLVALLAAIADESGLQLGLGGRELLVLWLGQLLLLLLFRSAARSFAMRRTAVERCVVVGDADAWARVRKTLAESPYTNSLVFGYLPIHRIRDDDPEPLGALADLDSVVVRHEVHRIIVSPPASGADTSLEVVRSAKALGIKVTLLPRILEVVGSSVAFDDVDGITLLGVRRFGLARSSSAVKRAQDVVGAIVGLLVTAPLLALIAAAIKLDSPGTVLFRQNRVGRHDEILEILKFRTMVTDAEERKAQLAALNEAEGLFKITDDPRVTRVGRFLRRTSLDELPQLVNVLRGDMSLVGPRPLVLAEDVHVEGWHRRRLHIKPGMTGPWQILGSGRIPLYEMVKIDYLYVANWSLWGDIKILLRTALYILARRNA
ncbi:MAG: exopolysaccharide biosynthesis polyprenyl glycosylphosphotransferase [Actinobacteria bacterium]|nr:exopolysaccharide biosynthesis polyprenyl glycosylphosphotransferase [Actinomycetota bacterium]